MAFAHPGTPANGRIPYAPMTLAETMIKTPKSHQQTIGGLIRHRHIRFAEGENYLKLPLLLQACHSGQGSKVTATRNPGKASEKDNQNALFLEPAIKYRNSVIPAGPVPEYSHPGAGIPHSSFRRRPESRKNSVVPAIFKLESRKTK